MVSREQILNKINILQYQIQAFVHGKPGLPSQDMHDYHRSTVTVEQDHEAHPSPPLFQNDEQNSSQGPQGAWTSSPLSVVIIRDSRVVLDFKKWMMIPFYDHITLKTKIRQSLKDETDPEGQHDTGWVQTRCSVTVKWPLLSKTLDKEVLTV